MSLHYLGKHEPQKLSLLVRLYTVKDTASGCYIVNTHQPVFSARCNIYISCLCYDVSVHLSVMEVHWHIIANLGFKF